MIEEGIIKLVKDVGFPIAISLYLLITQNTVIKKNTEATNNMSKVVKELKEIIRRNH